MWRRRNHRFEHVEASGPPLRPVNSEVLRTSVGTKAVDGTASKTASGSEKKKPRCSPSTERAPADHQVNEGVLNGNVGFFSKGFCGIAREKDVKVDIVG